MPKTTMKATLLRHTPDPEGTIALGAKLCYGASELDKLAAGVEKKDQAGFIRRLISMNHLSVMEHASFTYGISGVSRSLLAQITRHRIASFSVQSQRYVSASSEKRGGFAYVVPQGVERLGDAAVAEFEAQMAIIQGWYDGWVEKLGGAGEGVNEDARFVLPNAAATQMLVTMNARELMHFFRLRCCSRAQWEIRALAWEMLRQAVEVAPNLFENAGPACIAGPCPEGEKSCGKASEMKARRRALMEENHE